MVKKTRWICNLLKIISDLYGVRYNYCIQYCTEQGKVILKSASAQLKLNSIQKSKPKIEKAFSLVLISFMGRLFLKKI